MISSYHVDKYDEPRLRTGALILTATFEPLAFLDLHALRPLSGIAGTGDFAFDLIFFGVSGTRGASTVVLLLPRPGPLTSGEDADLRVRHPKLRREGDGLGGESAAVPGAEDASSAATALRLCGTTRGSEVYDLERGRLGGIGMAAEGPGMSSRPCSSMTLVSAFF